MIALASLLLLAAPPESAPPSAITIDPCVEVDPNEVRRLAAIELRAWQAPSNPAALEVVVVCREGVQELRLTDRERGRFTVRSIDLSTPRGENQEAKERELALAIAELLRRADAEPAEAPPALPEPAPAPDPPPVAPVEPEVPLQAWQIELGIAGVGVGWTGGEALFGADATGRFHVGRWLIAELRLGGRKTRSVALSRGSIDGHGVAAAAGLALDATPGIESVGASFGARFAGDWLRYAAMDDDVAYDGADALGVTLAGTATAFVGISGALRLTVDAAAGGALHSIAVRDGERRVSGTRGVLLSSAVGVAAQF